MKRIIMVFLGLVMGCTSKPPMSSQIRSSASEANEASTGFEKCNIPERKTFNPQQDRIVIIGAGVSGLGAARGLIENNVPAKNITIIEKNDSVGGKVSSFAYQGLTYELGAQIIIPDAYKEIETLRDEFGLTTRPLGRGMFIDLKDKSIGGVLTAEEIPAFSEQLKRYLTAYATQWNQPEGGQYHLLAADGFKSIHPDLKITWFDFIEKNNFQLINKALMSLLGGSGYAYRQANPTEASLIVRVLEPALMKSLFIDQKPIQSFNGQGYQDLWKKLAIDLQKKGVQVLLKSEVKKIQRSSNGAMKVQYSSRNKNKTIETDHVFFSADLSALPFVLDDMTSCEKDVVQNMAHSDYRSYLVKVKNLTALQNKSGGVVVRPYINGRLNDENKLDDYFGQPVLLFKPYNESDVLLAYVHGGPTVSEKQIQRNIEDTFAQMGATAKVLQSRKWYFFPRIKNDVETGYRQLLQLQGRGGLWMSGEIFSFAATHASYRNGYHFARLLTEGKLGL